MRESGALINPRRATRGRHLLGTSNESGSMNRGGKGERTDGSIKMIRNAIRNIAVIS